MERAIDAIETNHGFKHIVWLAEAVYSHSAFSSLKDRKNVLVFSLQNNPVSGVFAHLSDNQDDTRNYVKSVWNSNWISLIPLACNENFHYLYSLATSAILQMPEFLERPLFFGDQDMLNLRLQEFLSGECK